MRVTRSQLRKIIREAVHTMGPEDGQMATIVVDWANEMADLSTEDGILRAFHAEARRTGFRPTRVEVLQVSGPGGGWPELRLTAPADELRDWYVDVYSGGDPYAAEDFEVLARRV